jgi:hypothetical protein
MLSHEEAPAMQPSADECPAAGQCQFLAGRLRRTATGVGAMCNMSNRLSRIAYWLAVKKELGDARPATAEVHSGTRA